ncbi:MAG: 4-vinyl reductase [Methanomicrobiales archaeon]
MSERRYVFSWDLLGNLDEGRPNLGKKLRLEVYRLMQYTFRDVLEQDLGTEKADEIFYRAGMIAGTEFYRHVIGDGLEFNDFVKKLQVSLREMDIGVLRVEKTDIENGSFIFTVSEDVDCSGMPVLNYSVCTYDEGFIAGVMEAYTGKKFVVKEVDCWCTGDRTCRFTIDIMRIL